MSHIHIDWDFHVPGQYKSHPLRIYTPDAYDHEPERRFPVLYMHDGQNVFAHPASARLETWCANWTMERLIHEGRVEPWIIVGIDHSDDRFGEYSPWDEPRIGQAGRGAGYAEFVARHVKPHIDWVYRTRANAASTAIMGASLGGLMSLYMHYQYPDLFGRVGAVSPSVMWSDGAIFRHWTGHTRHWSRIQLDVGDHEFVHWDRMPLNYADATRAFYEQLCGFGYAPWELRLWMEPGGNHHELDWARRLPGTFEWVLS
jgi:predicted alpha/beta superfamily hydrolase